jgi:hypothetical protein
MGMGSLWPLPSTIDHTHLRRFLDQRVADGIVRRMIDKWLKAGVLETGVLRRTTPAWPCVALSCTHGQQSRPVPWRLPPPVQTADRQPSASATGVLAGAR